jgi:hypothetical protein
MCSTSRKVKMTFILGGGSMWTSVRTAGLAKPVVWSFGPWFEGEDRTRSEGDNVQPLIRLFAAQRSNLAGRRCVEPGRVHIARRNLAAPLTICTRGTLNLFSKRPNYQDSLLYTQFSRIPPFSISSFIYGGAHLSLYLNISIWDIVLKDLLKQI